MCFSATASFTAGACLLFAGAAAMNQSQSTPQKALSTIPVFFGLQQLSEGLLWMALTNPAYAQLERFATYTFLIFAQLVWPIVIPLSMYLFEEHRERKRVIKGLLITGVLTSLALGWGMWHYPVSTMVTSHHIEYRLDSPLSNRWFSGITYLAAAVVSPFFSSIKPLRFVGLFLLLSYIASRLFYFTYLISVWCFFAAILSVLIIVIIRRLRTTEQTALVPEAPVI